MDSHILYLPQEIIRNILKRLPVKSLIRFRGVCRQWKNLFNTPSFIQDHLHHSIHQNPSLLLVQSCNWLRKHSLNLDLLDCDMKVYRVQNPLSNGTLINGNIFGSSNGLLCVEIVVVDDDVHPSSFPLLLWNPAIREVRHVSKTMNDCQGRCHFGFGFSPIVDDYKIVRIYVLDVCLVHLDLGHLVVKTQLVDRVEVYSLRAGSWKEVEFGNLEGVSFTSKPIAVNGTIFWRAYKPFDLDCCLIVSFDIAEEVFNLLPIPPKYSPDHANLTVYENKLAMLCHFVDHHEYYWIEVFVLEETACASEGRWCWASKFTTKPTPFEFRASTIWNNEIVSFAKPEGEVENGEREAVTYLFNLFTNAWIKIATPSRSVGILNYVESLVSVHNMSIEGASA